MMNAWYPHYPGDYGRDTAHLSLVQHGAYRLLLDHYYATGAPLPLDIAALYRICRAFDESERKAVDFILSQFFKSREDGYHNTRADAELVKRAEHRERLSKGAHKTNEKRWGEHRPATRSAVASPQPQPQPKPKQEKAKTREAKPASPLFQSFLDYAFSSFQQKHSQKPSWGSKDFQNLRTLLERVNGLPLAELQRRWNNYAASTEPFTVKQGLSLAYFCSKFDAFLDRPICGPREKVSGNDAIAITIRSSGLDADGKLTVGLKN